MLGVLGPLVLFHGLFHRYLASLAVSRPGHRLPGPDLWRCAILRHMPLRSLLQKPDLLPSRGILLLVLFLLHELYLDCDSRL